MYNFVNNGISLSKNPNIQRRKVERIHKVNNLITTYRGKKLSFP